MGTDARDEMLRLYLERIDEPCPGCGYSLRGLRTTACPECGEDITLRVGLSEPRMGLFFAGLVGLAGGLGFSGMILAYAVWSWLAGVWTVGLGTFGTLSAGAGVCGVGVLVWLRLRGPIRRAPVVWRVCAVCVCWALAAGAAFAFFATGP